MVLGKEVEVGASEAREIGLRSGRLLFCPDLVPSLTTHHERTLEFSLQLEKAPTISSMLRCKARVFRLDIRSTKLKWRKRSEEYKK
jgi:hypothetical protein